MAIGYEVPVWKNSESYLTELWYNKGMRLILTSDLHGHLPPLPEADVAVIAGDLLPNFRFDQAGNQLEWMRKFLLPWAARQPVKEVVAIWGNHDFIGHDIYLNPDSLNASDYRWIMANFNDHHDIRFHILTDAARSVVVNEERVVFYGIPWTPTFYNWAFMLNDTDDELGVKFQHTPVSTHVMISHGPPEFGSPISKTVEGDRAGSAAQMRALQSQFLPNLQYIVCGHIHEGHGNGILSMGTRTVDVMNVSLVNRRLDPVNAPVLVDVKGDGI